MPLVVTYTGLVTPTLKLSDLKPGDLFRHNGTQTVVWLVSASVDNRILATRLDKFVTLACNDVNFFGVLTLVKGTAEISG